MCFHDEPRASDITLPIYSVFKERPRFLPSKKTQAQKQMGTIVGATVPIRLKGVERLFIVLRLLLIRIAHFETCFENIFSIFG